MIACTESQPQYISSLIINFLSLFMFIIIYFFFQLVRTFRWIKIMKENENMEPPARRKLKNGQKYLQIFKGIFLCHHTLRSFPWRWKSRMTSLRKLASLLGFIGFLDPKRYSRASLIFRYLVTLLQSAVVCNTH